MPRSVQCRPHYKAECATMLHYNEVAVFEYLHGTVSSAEHHVPIF